MKKIILCAFVILVAITFLSTPVMAKSKNSDHKPWYSYTSLKYKIKSLQRKLAAKIAEVKFLRKKVRTISEMKQGPPGPMGPPGPVGPQGPPGETTVVASTSKTAEFGDTSPLHCPGCWFPGERPPEEILSRLEGAYLPHAYMSGIDLSGAILVGTDLRGASITWANLSEADLTDVDFSPMHFKNWKGAPAMFPTDLKGTDLSGAILDGVIWENTICPDGTNSDNNEDTCENNLVPLKPEV